MWTRTLRKSLSENMPMDPNEFIKVLIVALNDKTIQDKLQDVISSDLKKEIAHLNDNLSKKDQVIKDLENKVSVLESKYDELEQYSRRNSLRITGLSENDNEDPCETTLNLFDRMDINPKTSIEDIDRVHRVGPKRGDNPRQMLIKFANYRARHRVLILLYYSFLYPYLSYCIEVWGNSYQTHLSSIFIIQKRAIRLLSFAPYRAHTDGLFQSLHILNLLHIPFGKLQICRRTIRYSGVQIWNDLCSNSCISVTCSLFTFKSKLKQLLLQSN